MLIIALCLSGFNVAYAYDYSEAEWALTDDFVLPNGNARTNNGWYWESNEINVYCPTLSSKQLEAVEEALAVWSYVSYGSYSVRFNFNTDCSASEAQITITNNMISKNTETGSFPIGDTECIGINGATSGKLSKAVITISTHFNYSYGSTESGKYYYASVVAHEIGHALGIAHCHELTNGDSCPSSSNCSANLMNPIMPIATKKLTLQSYDSASLISIYKIYHPFA